MLSSAITYFLMLAVMQFSVWFFVAIVLGLGLGELGFGRYCRTQGMLLRRQGASVDWQDARGAGYRDCAEVA
jgi:hypothetical protein